MSNDSIPYLKHVYLSADVYAACLQHAFTTEKEEVMGMLIGEVDETNFTSNITACIILYRSDKQPDRVEISPEQLCEAFNRAEELQRNLDRPMRVVGWYHSHPHITVWPSHVDVRTQKTYQMMDPLFVGLIFSVFTSDTGGSVLNKVEITCFQALSSDANPQRREIPLTIRPTPLEPYNLEAVTNLPYILMQEILDHYNQHTDNGDELATLHTNALKLLEMSHIISKITKPMFEDFLQTRLSVTETRIKELEALKQKLLAGKP